MGETTSLTFRSAYAFAQIASELYTRSGRGKTESGAFLLGSTSGTVRTVERAIYFDDVDPNAYHPSAITFDTTKIGAVYDLCEKQGLEIVGDIHVHPSTAFLSPTDAAHPVMAVAGHTGVILPYSGRYATLEQIAAHTLLPSGDWRSIPRNQIASFLGLRNTPVLHSTFDRTELLLLNSNVSSQRRAILLGNLALQIDVGLSQCTSPAGQASILTAVALGTRFCRAGVYVNLPADAGLAAQPRSTLRSVIEELGGHLGSVEASATLLIGRDAKPARGFVIGIQATSGSFGCAAGHSIVEDHFVPGVVAATAIAMGEIFRTIIMEKIEVRPRERWLKLFDQEERRKVPEDLGSAIRELAIAGFGHLGNAYAWVLAMTPGLRPTLRIIDNQKVDFANHSSQLFVRQADLERSKVDVAREQLKNFGFRIDADDRAIQEIPSAELPASILSGFDNVAARRALARTNARFIVDGGVGETATTFSSFSVYCVTDAAAMCDLFEDYGYITDVNRLVGLNSYKELREGASADATCGIYGVAEAAVAVPFVGAVVAALVITQLLRSSFGLPVAEVTSGDALSTNLIAL